METSRLLHLYELNPKDEGVFNSIIKEYMRSGKYEEILELYTNRQVLDKVLLREFINKIIIAGNEQEDGRFYLFYEDKEHYPILDLLDRFQEIMCLNITYKGLVYRYSVNRDKDPRDFICSVMNKLIDKLKEVSRFKTSLVMRGNGTGNVVSCYSHLREDQTKIVKEALENSFVRKQDLEEWEEDHMAVGNEIFDGIMEFIYSQRRLIHDSPYEVIKNLQDKLNIVAYLSRREIQTLYVNYFI